MESSKVMEALSSLVYVSKMQLNDREITTDDQRIRASGLFDEWTAGNHTVGEIFNTYHADGTLEQTWECFQAYNNAVYPDIAPGNSAWYTFNRPLHGKSRATARPFTPVQGSHDMYHTGEWMIFGGSYYECGQDTNFSPVDYARAWILRD